MIKNILWDFDGVILNSMHIRDIGFREIFKQYNLEDVQTLIKYHNINGGLSRYVKIRYFFEKIIRKPISDDKINKYAAEFSKIMLANLTEKSNLIPDSLNFIKSNFKNFNFHIVSGSDQKELRSLCDSLEIANFFITINGSPTPKDILISNLIKRYNYDISETCLIGDSVNDYEAARSNNITFFGYNNVKLKEIVNEYITRIEKHQF
tara:strand:- start:200 stop:820 length:621 start_codon:yes stop_codon:yes gene_type:complete